MSEHQHQVALFQWARKSKIPELELMFAIPNGGMRHRRVAQKLKAEGVKKGVPDVCLPVPRGGYHGLYIELKKPKDAQSAAGRATKEQLEWQASLTEQGYLSVICVGWEKAKEAIQLYLMESQEVDLPEMFKRQAG